MPSFVNPYAFVPLGEVKRSKPPGHHALRPEHYSGSVCITVTALTPLLLGVGDDQEAPPRNAAGEVIIPGSSLAGTVRSVHEALTSSCLRVVDRDFVPVHRQAMTVGVTEGLRMAVVESVNSDGIPTSVRLCEDVVWVNYRYLARSPDAPLSTMDEIAIPDGPRDSSRGKTRLRWPDDPSAAGTVRKQPGGHRLLITDSLPRGRGEAWFAAGLPNGEAVPVGLNAQADFALALEGAADLHGEGTPDTGVWMPMDPATRDPAPGAELVGHRWQVAARVVRGLPLWVTTADHQVDHMRLSQAWRVAGRGPVSDRIGTAGPCREDPLVDGLCPSCQVFGSAGADDAVNDGPTRQVSYAGHVRFGDAVAVADTVGLVQETRAPLGAPRPSSGQFYLQGGGFVGRDSQRQPLSTWGSEADATSPRPISGRKFYWRTDSADPATGAPRVGSRGLRREHHADSQVASVTLVKAGAVFTGTVRFDNVPIVALGSVLAALSPARLWDDVSVVTSVGGGKPFGWGAVRVELSDLHAETALSRYLGGPRPPVTIEQAVSAFAASVAKAAGEARWADDSAWPALRAALTFGKFRDDEVWYPPGDARNAAEADRVFEFWEQTSGLKDKGGLGRLASPDEPTEAHRHSLPRIAPGGGAR